MPIDLHHLGHSHEKFGSKDLRGPVELCIRELLPAGLRLLLLSDCRPSENRSRDTIGRRVFPKVMQGDPNNAIAHVPPISLFSVKMPGLDYSLDTLDSGSTVQTQNKTDHRFELVHEKSHVRHDES